MPMIQVDETLLNAKFRVLIEQRDNAMNAVVNLQGDLAVANEKIRVLEEKAAVSFMGDLVAAADAAAALGAQDAKL